MSYLDYETAVQLIKSVRVSFACPQSLENILKAEEKLAVKLPNSYKNFLQYYGWLASSVVDIFGLTNNNNFTQYVYENVVCNTLEERKVNISPPFPHSLVPIHALGNGELSCLDTSQMNENGECPVVAWYFGPTLPNGKLEVLAEDFGAFLLEKVQWGLESLREEEEEGKK
jgi:hypothetical protein